jgi:hypothetical protein
MTETPAAPMRLAEANGTPDPTPEERLRRIEVALTVLAAQSAAGPPPEGYASGRTTAGPSSLVPLSLAVQAARQAGYLPGAESVKRRRWYDLPVLRELYLAFRLYVDPRYSPTRWVTIVVPALLGFLVLNYLFWRGWLDWTVISPVFERFGVLVVGAVLYRIFTFEIARYAAVLDYLDRTNRPIPTPPI